MKPQNILLDPDRHAKVTDFGIARTAGTSNLTTANVVMGTAQYLAPEQVVQGTIDGRTDLYNVGIVLFEMLTGRPPFQGDSALTVALLQVHAAPPSPRTRRADLSPATDAIVLRALAKDPNARYQSAAEFREAVEVARASAEQMPLGTMPLPLAAPPGEPTAPVALAARSPVWWPSRRARWLLALPLLLVSIMLLGGKLSLGSPRVAFSDLQAASAATTATGSGTAPTTLPSATFAFSRLLSFPTATAMSPPSPTATPVPPTATAVPPSPTPAPQIVAQAPSPQAAVLGFYQMVAAHRFDVATALWTPNLQA